MRVVGVGLGSRPTPCPLKRITRLSAARRDAGQAAATPSSTTQRVRAPASAPSSSAAPPKSLDGEPVSSTPAGRPPLTHSLSSLARRPGAAASPLFLADAAGAPAASQRPLLDTSTSSAASPSRQNPSLQASTPTSAESALRLPAPLQRAGVLLSRQAQLLSRRAKTALRSPHDAAIWALAAPSIVALAADPLLAMVDTGIVGQLGEFQLAALGVNNSLFSFAFVVFNFLAVATTPLVAVALAADDKAKAGQTISQALLLAGLLGTAVTVTLELSSDSALHLMGLGNDEQLLTLAKSFLFIRATAAPAALLVTVSQGVFRGLQDMRTPLAVTLATNLLHLGLSLAFIFKCHMGLAGAALSTSVSEWLAALTYMYLGWQRRAQLGLSPWPAPVGWRAMQEQYLPFLQAGGAILMRTTVLLGTKTLAAVVATRLGPSAIASHQVLGQVWVLSSLIIDSLGIAGQTLVAVSLGTGDRHVARKVTDRLLQLGAALGLSLAGVLFLASPMWPHLFTQDTSVVSNVEALLPLAVAMLPINALVYVLDGALVGASDFHFLVGAMVLAAGSTTGLLLLVEPLHLGLPGVWGSMAVLMAGRLATLAWRYHSPLGPLPPRGATCPRLLPESAAMGVAAAAADRSWAASLAPTDGGSAAALSHQQPSPPATGGMLELPEGWRDTRGAQGRSGSSGGSTAAGRDGVSGEQEGSALSHVVGREEAGLQVVLPAEQLAAVRQLLAGDEALCEEEDLPGRRDGS